MRVLDGAFPEVPRYLNNHLAACSFEMAPLLLALDARAQQKAFSEDGIGVGRAWGDTVPYPKPERTTLVIHPRQDRVCEFGKFVDSLQVHTYAGIDRVEIGACLGVD